MPILREEGVDALHGCGEQRSRSQWRTLRLFRQVPRERIVEVLL
jgi:hypothetical protein